MHPRLHSDATSNGLRQVFSSSLIREHCALAPVKERSHVLLTTIKFLKLHHFRTVHALLIGQSHMPVLPP